MKSLKHFCQLIWAFSSETVKKQQQIVITMIKLLFPVFFFVTMQIFAASSFIENKASDISANKVSCCKRTLFKALNDTTFTYIKDIDSLFFNDKGQLVASAEFTTDSSVKRTVYFQYDEFDSLLSEVSLNDQGLPDNLRVNKYVYERDTLVEKKITNEDQFVIYRFVYKYQNGKISKFIHYDADGSSDKYDTLSYDSNGRIITFDTKMHFGKLISSINYLYDESGNLSFKRIENFEDGKKNEMRFVYSLNKLIIEESDSEKGVSSREIIRTGSGLIDEIILRDKDKHPLEKIKFNYYYIQND